MLKKVRFPKFDANIIEGMVGKWCKEESDHVRPGDKLVEIVTDKATFELEVDCSGKLLKIVAPEKSQVPVGYIIALVGDESQSLPDVSAENSRIVEQYQEAMLSSEAHTAEKAPSSPRPKRIRATPAARRIAREAGIDLARVPLPNGKSILAEEDVRSYVQKRQEA